MESFNPVEMFKHMSMLDKSVVVLLLVMSIYSLWVMIDRFAVFSKAKRYSLAFVLALRDRMAKRDLNGALNLSKAEPQSPIAKVIYEALTEYRDGLDAIAKTGPDEVGEFDVVDAVNRAIDRVKEREVANMKRGLGGLGSISSAAPFIGLFGTVIGIMTSFQAIAGSKNTSLAVVAPGIAEALLATAIGLLAAIPAVIAYNKLSSDASKLAVRMEGFSDEFSAILSRQIDEKVAPKA